MSIQRPGEYKTPEQIAEEMEAEVQASLKEPRAAEAPATAPKGPATPATPPGPLTWEERIKAAELTQDQAHEILTAMLTTGFYEKTFKIYGRVNVTLRSRDGYARQRLIDITDQYRVADERMIREIYLRVALAGSLVCIGETVYPHVPATEKDPVKREQAFTERLNLLDRVPDAIFEETLQPLIRRFDGWIYAALSNGAPSGF